MKIELKRKTEKFTGKMMHYIYVDDTFITCKTDPDEAIKAYEEAIEMAKRYPEDKWETLQSISYELV